MTGGSVREADALDYLDVVVERLTRQFQPLRIILGKVVFERDYQPSAEAAERSLVGAAARDVAEGSAALAASGSRARAGETRRFSTIDRGGRRA